MNKQIEEMAFDLCRIDRCKHLPQTECNNTTCAHCEAEALYNAGYRKQREGYWYKHDKKKHGDTCYYCSACEGMALADYMTWELTDYCPKCGAQMKGDKTDA